MASSYCTTAEIRGIFVLPGSSFVSSKLRQLPETCPGRIDEAGWLPAVRDTPKNREGKGMNQLSALAAAKKIEEHVVTTTTGGVPNALGSSN